MNLNNQLPPEVLSMIFHESILPQQNRIQLPAAKLSISFLGSGSELQPTPTDLVVADGCFTDQFIRQIINLCPDIAELFLEIFSKTSYKQLPKLLVSYQPTLTTLKLFGLVDHDQGFAKYLPATSQLIETLNDLPNLTNLQLGGIIFHLDQLYTLAPTLSRLEHFAIIGFAHRNFNTSSFEFGQNLVALLSDRRCTSLKLPSEYLQWWLGQRFYQFGDHLKSLGVHGQCDKQVFNGICWRLFRLNCLRVSQLPLNTTTLRRLARLEHLSALKLKQIQFEPHLLTAPLPTDTPLDSIEQLTLQFEKLPENNNNNNINQANVICNFCINLQDWFPRLDKLKLQVNEENDYVIFKNALEDWPNQEDGWYSIQVEKL